MKNHAEFLFLIISICIFLLPINEFGQEEQPTWKRSDTVASFDLHLFRSTQSINLPTAETLEKNNLEFEISHRFIPYIKSGVKNFWGFDGPVNMRIALSYAPTNKTVIALGRSNLDDNVDLWVKQNLIELKNDQLPTVIGARVGAAWNSQPGFPIPGRSVNNEKNFQYYGQLILNSMFSNKLAVGLVPSYLYNSYIFTNEKQYSFTLGTNFAFYLNDMFGLLFEWNPLITGFRLRTNPVAFGLEINTGGHFFKIIVTNSDLLNPSQYLSGARDSFSNGEWHIGFNITRLLKL